MATITAQMVKDLRTSTGAGMMDCKKALNEADGDMDKAVVILREKGIAKAAKKSDRVASEGAISVKVSPDYSKAVVCEINSETDFVAKNDNFISLVNETTNYILNSSYNTTKEFMDGEINGTKVSEYMIQKMQIIGEKIDFRRFKKITCGDDSVVNGYLHSNGKVGVIVSAKTSNKDAVIPFLKDVAMHVAAMNPIYLQASDINDDVIEKEKEIAKVQLINEGKPENMIDKIIPGKIKKFSEENSLITQKFIKDDKLTVAQALKNISADATITSFFRFELGDGIEKVEQDFASEVASQLA